MQTRTNRARTGDGSKVYAAGDVAPQSTIGAAKVASTATISE